MLLYYLHLLYSDEHKAEMKILKILLFSSKPQSVSFRLHYSI